MQTRLLRLAFLGLVVPAAALAQTSNVTMYGRANLDIEYDKASGSSGVVKLVNNASRWGIRGDEDLGSGLKAIFQLESSINWDSGGGTLAGRETYVGLAGTWGTFQMGRKLDPMYSATWDSMPEPNHDTGNGSDALFGQAMNTQTAVAYGGVFVPNSVYYRTPKVAGFTGEVTYSALSETANPRVRYMEAVVSYGNGPFYIGTGYGDSKTANATTTNRAERNKAWPIVVVYDAKWLIVAGGYERAWRELPGSPTVTRNYWRVAGEVPVGPHEFHVSFGHAGSLSNLSDSGADQWILGYNYNLSKRTKLYLIYSRVDNDRNGAYGFLTSSPGVDNSAVGVGMRMNF